MSYKEKLDEFNATEKYKKELHFLRGLIICDEKILDYGCGTGFAVEHFRNLGIKAHGYDISEVNIKFHYCDLSSYFKLTYFMHSFAHIEDPETALKELKTDKIVIITPNKDWLVKQYNLDYRADTTVKNHYSQSELVYLVESCGFEIELVGQFGNETQKRNERIFLTANRRK